MHNKVRALKTQREQSSDPRETCPQLQVGEKAVTSGAPWEPAPGGPTALESLATFFDSYF